jgi:hypothetical protein
MKLKRQSGFSAVAALLILVIVGIIGGTGWYVVQANNKATDTLDNAGLGTTAKAKKKKQTAPPSTTSTDETDKWFLYTSKNNEYKIRLADGLVFSGPFDDSYPFINTRDLNTKNGVPAKVIAPLGGSDNPIGLFINFYSNATDAKVEGNKQSGFTTKSGLNVDKYYLFQNSEPEGIGVPKGGKSYYYRIVKGGEALNVNYAVAPGAPDYYVLVEKMVKTVELP